VQIVLIVVYYALWLYLLLLLGRLIIEVLQAYSRSWTPAGALAKVAEVIFTATDPPLRFLRRHIPPLRLGNVGLDLSYILLFLVIFVLTTVVGSFIR
jgi:YggT family protein